MGWIVGKGIGVPFRMGGGQSWSTYWSRQSEVLFFGLYSEIADGKMPNKVDGGATYLTVVGSAGSETYQCPDTASYIAADTDFVWFREGDSSRRIATTPDLIGFDFSRTIIRYDNESPYAIKAIMILKAGETQSASKENKMRDDFWLSVWWDGVLSSHGYVKGNRSSERSVWNLGYEDETITHIARVVADGGTITVAEQESTDADIKFLKSIDAYNDLNRILLPYGGVKLRTVGADNFVSKWYDFKGVSCDVTQETEASQPKYGAVQYNAINVISCSSSVMNIPAITWNTLITINSGTGYLLCDSDYACYVRNTNTTTLVLRDTASDSAAHTMIDKTYKIDSVLKSGGTASAWRNKTASVSNPVSKGNTVTNLLFQRLGSTYWTGSAGVFLFSTSAITTTKRALIEDYYIAKFAIS